MKIIDIIQTFKDENDSVDYLCNLRWAKDPQCPYCRSIKTGKKKEHGRRSRLQCHTCQRSFSPTINTIMHGTRLPLFKWFLAVALITEAKKSISSRQLARHLDIPVKTAYSVSQRIRKAMLGTKSPILQGIIEIDETYIGGKPRYKKPENKSKRGRGTDKQMVVGMVEREGSVITSVPANNKYNSTEVRNLVFENVDIENSEIYSDDYKVYNKVGNYLPHDSVNHSAKEYVKGHIHTNTIEGFWSLVKRAWYGTHHYYTKKYLPLYMAEAEFKYNYRDNEGAMFNTTMKALV